MARNVATTRTVASRRRSSVNFPYALRWATTNNVAVTLDSNVHFATASPFAVSIWFNFERFAVIPANASKYLCNAMSDSTHGFILMGYSFTGTGSSSPFLFGSAAVTAPFIPEMEISSLADKNTVRNIARKGWHMATVTFDGVDYTAMSSYAFYLDATSYAIGATTLAIADSNINRIGYTATANTAPTNTSVTRYRVWSGGSAMTASQVADLYYDDKVPSGPTLIREYLFTEGTGTVVADTSGNGFNGTKGGTSTTLAWTTDTPGRTRTAASTVRTTSP